MLWGLQSPPESGPSQDLSIASTIVRLFTETLEKEVEVEAEDRDEAEQIVSDAWHNSEYILDAEDFKGVTFKAEPPARKRESYER